MTSVIEAKGVTRSICLIMAFIMILTSMPISMVAICPRRTAKPPSLTDSECGTIPPKVPSPRRACIPRRRFRTLSTESPVSTRSAYFLERRTS